MKDHLQNYPPLKCQVAKLLLKFMCVDSNYVWPGMEASKVGLGLLKFERQSVLPQDDAKSFRWQSWAKNQ